jgi:peptidyl-prolyl cis-trans isomerase SurA
MPRALAFTFLLILVAAPQPRAAAAQTPQAQPEIVDRIVARIEDDIITLSEMRELSDYQQLLDDRSDDDNQLRSELIEQWIVNNEATGAHFPAPAESEVDREFSRIQGRFPTPAAFQQRLAALGLTARGLRGIVSRQIYFARYLDYKFRSAVQVEGPDIEKYYRDQFVPALEAKSEKAPPLDSVREQIQELLIEQGVDTRAAAWFDETKSRLKIELEPLNGKLTGSTK